MMPLYTELLATALAEPGPEPDDTSPGALLVVLLDRGLQIRAAPSPIDRLALELRYDVALIRLCSAMGVPADPARFDPPIPAREELEARLRSAGVPVAPDGLEPARSEGSP